MPGRVFPSIDLAEITRKDFPIFSREIFAGVPLVYLDTTATAQKPHVVLDAMDQYYRRMNANIHRGVHTLAEEATASYESAREKISAFIHAGKARQVIFTRNTTESINLVANTWGKKFLKSGDTIVLTEMEHHSNLVPWQMLAEENNLHLEFIPIDPEGRLDLSVYDQLLKKEPKLVAFTHMSNVLGTINPAREIIEKAHLAGAITLVDAAQSVPHMAVSVTELGVDFLAFSAHKMCGPTGIGVLYGKEHLLEEMPPFLGGGDMIRKVFLRSFQPNEIPHKFEAGTPAIAEAIGFGAAVDYLSQIGMDNIAKYEVEIISYAFERLEEIPGVIIYGPPADERGGVLSFSIEGIHPHDVAQILDRDGIAIRAGHHCAMPLHDILHVPATSRASFYFYNTFSEVDRLVESIHTVKVMFGR